MKNKYIQPTVDFCVIIPDRDIMDMSAIGAYEDDERKTQIGMEEFFGQ